MVTWRLRVSENMQVQPNSVQVRSIMRINHTYRSYHQDQAAAISAVVHVSTLSAHSHSHCIHMEFDAGRVFPTRDCASWLSWR
jgi:hypothetical protein